MTRRKKKAYLSVIALALLLLGIDRVFRAESGAPASAVASIPGTSTAPGLNVQAGQEGVSSSIPEIHFPRLSTLPHPEEELADIFAPPAQMTTDSTTIPDPVEAPDPARQLEDFASSHSLDAVFSLDSNASARINGVWYAVGEEVGECTLAQCRGNEILLVCPTGKVILTTTADATVIPNSMLEADD